MKKMISTLFIAAAAFGPSLNADELDMEDFAENEEQFAVAEEQGDALVENQLDEEGSLYLSFNVQGEEEQSSEF